MQESIFLHPPRRIVTGFEGYMATMNEIHAVKLFYGIQSAAEKNNSRTLAAFSGEQILFSISDLEIMPSSEDTEKFIFTR